ncbi:MAG: hypothetical protein R3F24_04115 [Gammaproteobacteria bacterium]
MIAATAVWGQSPEKPSAEIPADATATEEHPTARSIPDLKPESDQLAATRERFRNLMAEGRHEEATQVASQLVDLARVRDGPDSTAFANALSDLATAQLRAGNRSDAETNFKAALVVVEQHLGFLSPELSRPLSGLGATYLANEQYQQAAKMFERALHVNHVNEGFYNLAQNPIRDGLTEAYLGLGDLEEANRQQEAQLYAQQRNLGPDNPELIPALDKIGRWYSHTLQAESARLAYQHTERLVEDRSGKDSPALVEPLLAIASTYRQQALLPVDPDSQQGPETLLPKSAASLRQALDIVDQQQPPDTSQRAHILVELGDLYQLWGKRNTSRKIYEEAWQVLSAAPDLEATRNRYFAQPARIVGAVPPSIFPVPARTASPPTAKKLEPGYVTARYSVNELGQVSDVTIVEADPANLIEGRVSDAISNAIYRPRYVSGVPVATDGLIYRHDFRYAPAKLKQAKKDPITDAGDDNSGQALQQPSSIPASEPERD